MIDGSIGESVRGIVDKFAEIQAEIAATGPIVLEELAQMDDQTLWQSVCHNVIGNTLETVKEGTHLYQCAWDNRQIFNDRNEDEEYMRNHEGKHKYMIADDLAIPDRDREKQPEIMVNIARLSRFSVTCPYHKSERCPRRLFQFTRDEAKHTQKGRIE